MADIPLALIQIEQNYHILMGQKLMYQQRGHQLMNDT